MKIAHDGIREESLIVNSEHIHGFRHDRGYVQAEAIVKLVDAEGKSWIGNVKIRIPVELSKQD